MWVKMGRKRWACEAWQTTLATHTPFVPQGLPHSACEHHKEINLVQFSYPPPTTPIKSPMNTDMSLISFLLRLLCTCSTSFADEPVLEKTEVFPSGMTERHGLGTRRWNEAQAPIRIWPCCRMAKCFACAKRTMQ